MGNRFLDFNGSDAWNGEASSTTTSVLADPLNIGESVLEVSGNTSEWPSSGNLLIDSEYISYTGKTGTTLTGLSRAQNASIEANHLVGATLVLCDASWDVVGPYRTLDTLLGDSAGNTLYVASGKYNGASVSVVDVEIYATDKNVIIDGDNSYNYALDATGDIKVEGIEFRDFLSAAVRSNSANDDTIIIRNCVFRGSSIGLSVEGSGNPIVTLSRNTFRSNVIGISWTKAGDKGSIAMNNTFVGNTSAIKFDPTMNAVTRFWNNAFVNNTQGWLLDAITDLAGSVDYNGYYNNARVGRDAGSATDYGTLALWQAATGSEVNSRSDNPSMNDLSLGMFGLQPSSTWRNAGANDFPIGAFGVSYAISQNINATKWGSNGFMVDTQEVAGNVVLSTNPVGTFATDILDLGQTRSIRDVKLFGIEDLPDSKLDKDNTDEMPNLATLEIRGDTALFLKNAVEAGDLVYTEFERGNEPVIPSGNAKRFVQVRVTLRDDA
jgi:hypothetical protein